jgi:RNA polymerase sigma-70 factor (ECF subfamily)
VSAWLFGITRNRAIDMRRSRQQQARQREEELPADPSMLKGGAQPDESELVALHVTMQAALKELSPAQREAIDLAYYGDLSQSEVAKQLGEPLGTVKTRIRAGLERLRRTLQPSLHPDAETRLCGSDAAP